MLRVRTGLVLSLVVGLAAVAQGGGDKMASGNWKLSSVSGASEFTNYLLKVEKKDGTLTGSMLAVSPRLKGDYSVKSFAVTGGVVRAVIKAPAGELLFEGVITSDSRKILGSFGTDTQVQPAYLTATDITTLDAKDSLRTLDVPQMQKAQTLANQALVLRFKAQQTKDAEQRAKLLKEAAEAEKRAQLEVPTLYREVIEKHSDSPAVITAAMNLLRGAAKDKASADEVKKWVNVTNTMAKAHGPRMQRDMHAQIAGILVNQEGQAALALENAKAAERLLDATSSTDQQVRVLNLLATALKKTGSNEVKAIEARLAKLDEVLDREYLAKVPPFKATPFGGRKAQSDRVVVMELFTGAQCPPCVAADVAFDVLQKSYKTTELVLIQYHVHIPLPDPMTIPDSEARLDYYVRAYKDTPLDVRKVAPTSMFNGAPGGGAGGTMAVARKKYEQYCSVINPLLEKPASAKITATANRQGDKIAINVKVSGLENPGADKKLRMVLVEETIRYVGGNKIRFHHNVVRAMPGGAEGIALKDKNSQHTATVDLAALRKQLHSYLDDYAANKRPFPTSDRPMNLDQLRVIALVQDDATHEILQATQVDVANVNGRR